MRDHVKGEYFMPFSAMLEAAPKLKTAAEALAVNRKLAKAGVIKIIRELPHGIIARYLVKEDQP